MKRYLLVAITLLVTFGILGTTSTMAQGPEGVVISSPTDGQTVEDVVVVTGAISFADFLKYDFFLKTGDNMIWVATGFSPVINGNLLRLDTRTFPDGAYQVVVRKVTSDSNYTDTAGPAFTIQNNQTAPNPYPEIETTFLYPAPGKATVRFRNCTGEGFFVDYNSPEGFKSAGEVNLAPWPGEGAVCTYSDAALIPGEYRGTGKGEAQLKGINYTLKAEAGKVYEMTYNGPAAGRAELYLTEVKPDERADTDTGGLNSDDPTRKQTVEDIQGGSSSESGDTEMMDDAEQSSAGEEAMAETDGDAEAQATTETVLPESGQAIPDRAPFALSAVALLALMVVGGLFAMRKGKQSA
jgi:hypothetical protein